MKGERKRKDERFLKLQIAIGLSLRSYRKKTKKLTQQDVADLTELSRTEIVLVEKGERLTIETLILVAESLGLKASYILSRFGY